MYEDILVIYEIILKQAFMLRTAMLPCYLDCQNWLNQRLSLRWMRIWTPILARRTRNILKQGPMQRKWKRQSVSLWMACLVHTSTYLYILVCTSTYQFVLHCNLYLPVCARLHSSMRLSIKPRKDHICTGYHMLQILVTRFKKFL